MAEESMVRTSLTQVFWDDTQVINKGFEPESKLGVSKHYGKHKSTPYAIQFDEEDNSFKFSDIDYKQLEFFRNVYKKQQETGELGTIFEYVYLKGEGSLVENNVFYNCWIEKISHGNAGEPFSIEGGYVESKY